MMTWMQLQAHLRMLKLALLCIWGLLGAGWSSVREATPRKAQH